MKSSAMSSVKLNHIFVIQNPSQGTELWVIEIFVCESVLNLENEYRASKSYDNKTTQMLPSVSSD